MLSSGLDGDLDAWRTAHASAVHGLAELAAVGEPLRGFEAREPVDDEHVVFVTRVDRDIGLKAAVLLSQIFHAVVHHPPGAVVLDLVPDDQSCGGYGVLPFARAT